MESADSARSPLKARLREVIFGFESRAGRTFDVILIGMIVASVAAVMIDSVPSLGARHGDALRRLEWFFTIAFTVEYCLRLYSAENRRGYAFSFYGLIDLVSVLPTYIAFVYPSAQYLIVVRIMRILRIFRILKLLRYAKEADLLYRALTHARRKILVFLFSVLTLIVIFGALMFLIEGPRYGFTSIPRSIYWAIVTITTVGYGDISPQTPFGQFVAGLAMICGYAIIAVPTGIIGAELFAEAQARRRDGGRRCGGCGGDGHERDAAFCRLCGARLGPGRPEAGGPAPTAASPASRSARRS